MLITPHFALVEFACRDGTPYPAAWVADRLRPLCEALEALRAACGARPLRIVSGYRTATWNARVGGAPRSQHVEGRAADVAVEGLAAAAAHRIALDLYASGRLRIGGLGVYPSWVHVDVRPSDRLAQWSGGGATTEAV